MIWIRSINLERCIIWLVVTVNNTRFLNTLGPWNMLVDIFHWCFLLACLIQSFLLLTLFHSITLSDSMARQPSPNYFKARSNPLSLIHPSNKYVIHLYFNNGELRDNVCVVVVDDGDDGDVEKRWWADLLHVLLPPLSFLLSHDSLFSSWKPSMTMPMRILHVP